MTTIADLMDGIAAQLRDAFTDITDVPVHIEGRMFTAAEMPCIDMFPTAASGLESGLAAFQDMYGGIPLNIRCRVSVADVTAGEDLLLEFMDDEAPLSVIAALDSDRTVGGLAQTIGWGDGWPWSGYADYPDPNGDGSFLGSALSIIVVKAHS